MFKDLPIASLRPNPDQPRKNFDEDALDELAASILQNGLIQPIVVRRADCNCRPGHVEPCYQIVAGERRFRACQRAGIESAPCNILNLNDEQTMVLAITENVTRRDMDEMEEARAYGSLVNMGQTVPEIAGRFGKSPMWIQSSLDLLSLIDTAQWLVAKGQMSKNVGCYLARLEVERQKEVLRRVTAGEFRTNDEILRFCTVAQKVQDQPGLFDLPDADDPLTAQRREAGRRDIDRAWAKVEGLSAGLGLFMELDAEAVAFALGDDLPGYEARLDLLVKCVNRARTTFRDAAAIRKVVAA